MYSCASLPSPASSRNFTRPPRKGFRYSPRICIAVKPMFHSRLSSSSRPTPRLSSETKAMPIDNAARGSLRLTGVPFKRTVPPPAYKPMMPFGMPSLPWPASPPIPNISPLRTENDTSRTASPGMSTHRRSTLIVSSPKLRVFKSGLLASTERPTIHAAMSRTVVPAAGASLTTRPSRSTTIVSATAATSCSLCDMNIIEIP